MTDNNNDKARKISPTQDMNPGALAEYALTVDSSTRAFLASAVTRLAQELE